MKKLTSTSFATESKNFQAGYQPTLSETDNPQSDKNKTTKNGKIFTLTRDKNNDKRIDARDPERTYLKTDGDLRGEEIKKLRDEADATATNPPFSLLREFLAWTVEAEKKFLTTGNTNATTYKEVFPLTKNNKIWLGVSSGAKTYTKPDKTEQTTGNTRWFVNTDHGRRHRPLAPTTELDVTKSASKKPLEKYDNYDAIEIPLVKYIPSDYKGTTGAPTSLSDKYCPEQSEIVGTRENEDLYKLKTKFYTTAECKQAYLDKFKKKGTYDLNASGVIIENGLKEKVYQRILIRHKGK